jgi:hypothetical protein
MSQLYSNKHRTVFVFKVRKWVEIITMKDDVFNYLLVQTMESPLLIPKPITVYNFQPVSSASQPHNTSLYNSS